MFILTKKYAKIKEKKKKYLKAGNDMNPLIPMLAITGAPTNERLEKMLLSYKMVGIDTVMLYPRAGLEIEYMSELR